MKTTSFLIRCTALFLAVVLSFSVLEAAAPRAAALETTAWGEFARYYGEQYRKDHPTTPPQAPEKGSYGEALLHDYGTAGYNGAKELLSRTGGKAMEEKAGEYLTKNEQSYLDYLQEMFEDLAENQKPRGRHHQLKKKLWKAEKNMYKEAIEGTKQGIDKMKKFAGKLVNTVFFLWNAYEYLTKEDDVKYKSPFLQFCADALAAADVFAVYIPGYGWVVTVADVVVNSETLKKYVNETKWGQSYGKGDNLIDWTNWIWQKIWEPSMNWWYGGQIEENERRAEEMKEKCRGASCTANYMGCYKPNIYLYPTEETEVTVLFGLPELLTVTDPVYENGWTATASPNGILTTDQGSCEYLFYESRTQPWYWQTEEGYFIPADDRDDSFARVLAGYGLNAREIEDFTAFWTEKLEPGTDYAMYPQLTDAVDLAMPVEISPAPDSVLRLWFAFVPGRVPDRTAEPEPLVREGFTVVEWGGFFLPTLR